jgi:hypothetical protein
MEGLVRSTCESNGINSRQRYISCPDASPNKIRWQFCTGGLVDAGWDEISPSFRDSFHPSFGAMI